MKINYNVKPVTFNQVKESDLFVYGGELCIKRAHIKDISTYNCFKVGKPNSGLLLGPSEDIIPVTEITVS